MDKEKELSNEIIKIDEEKEECKNEIYYNFIFYSIFSILYGLFFTFSFFDNLDGGITYPVFVIGTFIFLIVFMKKANIDLKKESYFYIICSILLGISACMTNNFFFHFFNSIGIIFLIAIFLLSHTGNDKEWGFITYLINMIKLFFSMMGYIFYPFIHLNSYINNRLKEKKKNEKVKNVMIGIIIGIPLFLVITLLLSSADQIFSSLFSGIFHKIIIPENGIVMLVMTIIGFLGMYTLICSIRMKDFSKDLVISKKEPVIAITFTLVLAFVYIIFCSIQILYLFKGGFLSLPDNFTYAEYARRGFFELLTVSIINFFMIMICIREFKESKILHGILTIISICNYILIGSSFYRMVLYIKEYRLTFLRVLVIWFLCVLAILMAGTLASIYYHKFPIFKFVMTVVSISYIIFSFSKPDYIIADYNISNSDKMNVDEVLYLTNYLSDDAAPLIKNIDIEKIYDNEEKYYEYGNPIEGYYLETGDILDNYFLDIEAKYENSSIRSYNFSRSKALKIANEYLGK